MDKTVTAILLGPALELPAQLMNIRPMKLDLLFLAQSFEKMMWTGIIQYFRLCLSSSIARLPMLTRLSRKVSGLSLAKFLYNIVDM